MPIYLALLLSIALSAVLTVALATAFWLLWTACGIGAHYFNFLPPPWHSISLLHMIGLFGLAMVARSLIVGVQLQLKQ
jgi:hypothetical protein